MRVHVLAATVAALWLAAPMSATAAGDVFNGRIAFSSLRVDPPPGKQRTGDIFTMNPDGTDLRQLTANPQDDAQADWSPDGKAIAYRIRKPNSQINFEVARMTASGADPRRLTNTATGENSSQPGWFPDGSGILFRRSDSGLVGSIWGMGSWGEAPTQLFDPAGPQWYPSWSPDMRKVLFATTTSPDSDSDRGIFTLNADGTNLTTLFDVAGAFDSAPAWSPDGSRIAFETSADVLGGNPEGDMEIFVMDADGSDVTQLTHNTAHDEGPAWSPDGSLLAYTSGPDNDHGDIHVMTATGVHLRQLTFYEGADESPDWQPIPAPPTDRRCGDPAETVPGAHDVRAAGQGLSCKKALELAARWSPATRPAGGPTQVDGFDAHVADYGGTLRVVLTHRANQRDDRGDEVVAFLYQPPSS